MFTEDNYSFAIYYNRKNWNQFLQSGIIPFLQLYREWRCLTYFNNDRGDNIRFLLIADETAAMGALQSAGEFFSAYLRSYPSEPIRDDMDVENTMFLRCPNNSLHFMYSGDAESGRICLPTDVRDVLIHEFAKLPFILSDIIEQGDLDLGDFDFEIALQMHFIMVSVCPYSIDFILQIHKYLLQVYSNKISSSIENDTLVESYSENEGTIAEIYEISRFDECNTGDSWTVEWRKVCRSISGMIETRLRNESISEIEVNSLWVAIVAEINNLLGIKFELLLHYFIVKHIESIVQLDLRNSDVTH